MQLQSEIKRNTMVITICEDRVDAAVAVQFKDSVKEAAGDGPDRIVLDMQNVVFLDSSGLGAVIGVRKVLAERTIELAGLTSAVAKVFRLTRMDTIFTIHDSVDDALHDDSTSDAAHAC